MYVCLSVRLSHLRSAGSAERTSNKNQIRSHVLFTSSIFIHSSAFILNRYLSILNNTQSSEDSEDYILFFQYFIFVDDHFLFFFLLCCQFFFMSFPSTDLFIAILSSPLLCHTLYDIHEDALISSDPRP